MADTYPPLTTSNIPAGWNRLDRFDVILTAVDQAGIGEVASGIYRTFYTTDGSEPDFSSSYGPNQPNDKTFFSVSGQGIKTVKYFSVDNPTTTSVNSQPYNINDGNTIIINVVGQSSQTITFNASDFVNINAATATEIANAINSQCIGIAASNYAGKIKILGNNTKSFKIIDDVGSPNSQFGFSTSDIFGNAEFTRTQLVYLDNVVPHTTLSTSFGPDGNDGWYLNSPQIYLIASDTTSGVNVVYYRWNNNTFQTYTTSFVIPSEGIHTLQYYAVDNAGNVEGLHTTTFKLDNEAPTTEDDAPSGTQTQPATVHFFYSDNVAGVANTYYTTDGSTPTTSSPSGSAVELKDSGTYIIKYFSVDFAGNSESVKQAAVDVNIDVEAPHVYIAESFPINGKHGWYRTSPQITLSSSEPCSILYRIYPQGADTTAKYTSTVQITTPIDCSAKFYIKLDFDQANSPITANIRGIVPSQTSILEIINNINAYAGKTVAYQTNAQGGTGTGYITIKSPTAGTGSATSQVSFLQPTDNDATNLVFGLNESTYPHIYLETVVFNGYSVAFSIPSDGYWTVDYYGTDNAGNKGQQGTKSYKLDSHLPVTTHHVSTQPNPHGWYVTSPNITLSVVETLSGIDQTLWQWDNQQLNVWHDGDIITIPSPGTHLLRYYSIDLAGNIESVHEVQFKLDNSPPITTDNTFEYQGIIFTAFGYGWSEIHNEDSTFIDYTPATGESRVRTENKNVKVVSRFWNETKDLDYYVKFIDGPDKDELTLLPLAKNKNLQRISDYEIWLKEGINTFDVQTFDHIFRIYNRSKNEIYLPTAEYIITAANNKLDFRVGITNYTITIPIGEYTGPTLSVEISSLLNVLVPANFSPTAVSYSNSRFTILGIGAFNLLWATGANANLSVGKTLGFDNSSDEIGLSTYTSDYIRVGLSGEKSVDAGNILEVDFAYKGVPISLTDSLSVDYQYDTSHETIETLNTLDYTIVTPFYTPVVHDHDVSITLTPNDDYSGISETHYRVLKNGNPYLSGLGTSFTLTENGTYAIFYYSIDAAGNVETEKSAQYLIVIDKHIPQISFAETPNPTGRLAWYVADFPLKVDISTDDLVTITNESPTENEYNIGTNNNKINFREGAGPELTATITSGVYLTGLALASEIQNRLNTTPGIGLIYSVGYSNYRFIISATGNFDLLWSSGTDNTTSIGRNLNFDITTDDTNNSNYTSDYFRIKLAYDLIESVQNAEYLTTIYPVISIENGASGFVNEVILDGIPPVNISDISVDYTYYAGMEHVDLTLDVVDPLSNPNNPYVIANDLSLFKGIYDGKANFQIVLTTGFYLVTDGTHSVYARAYDYNSVGRTGIPQKASALTRFDFKLDHVKPVTTDDAGTLLDIAQTLSSNSEPFNLNSGDQLLISIDGGANQTATFGSTGSYTASQVAIVLNSNWTGITAVAESGKIRVKHNIAGNNHYFQITDSTGNPNVQLGFSTSQITGSYLRAPVTVHLSASDAIPGSGIDETYYSIDGQEPIESPTNPHGTTIIFTNSGVYTIKYFSIDKAGNKENTKTALYQVYVDADIPVTTLVTYIGPNPASPDGNNNWFISQPTIHLNASDISGIYKTYYKLAAGIFTEYIGPFLLPNEGETAVQYYSIDNVGNQESIKTAIVKWDQTVPVTTTNIPVGYTNINDVEFTITDTHSGGYTTYFTFSKAPDPPPPNPTPSSQHGSGITFNSSGTYTIKFFSEDNAGNYESVQTVTLNLDIDPPTIFDFEPTGGIVDDTTTEIKFKIADDLSGVDISQTIFEVDGVEYSANKNASYYSYSGTPAQYQVRIFPIQNILNFEDIELLRVRIVKDFAGNLAVPLEFNFVPADTEPPRLKEIYPIPNAYDVSTRTNVIAFLDDDQSGVNLRTVKIFISQQEFSINTFKILKIHYTGTETDVKLIIQNNTLRTYINGRRDINVSFLDINYTTVKKVNDFINNLTDYTCSVLDTRYEQELSKNLLNENRTDITSERSLDYYLPELNKNFTYIERDLGYVVFATPSFEFEHNISVGVVIEAADNDGNVMQPYSYNFTPSRVALLSVPKRNYLNRTALTYIDDIENYIPSNYTRSRSTLFYGHFKSIGLELARFQEQFDHFNEDLGFSTVRTQNLWQKFGYLIQIKPDSAYYQEQYRQVLLSLLSILFKGSLKSSLEEGIKIITGIDVIINEAYTYPTSNISDQFIFDVDVLLGNQRIFNYDLALISDNIKKLFELVKPAHTFFRQRFIWTEEFLFQAGCTLLWQKDSFGNYIYDQFGNKIPITGADGFQSAYKNAYTAICDRSKTSLTYKNNEDVRLDCSKVNLKIKTIEENVSLQFTGTNDTFGTYYFPLLKNIIPPQIATISDVSVTVNSFPAAIDTLDPLNGIIKLVATPAYNDTVIVTYYYNPYYVYRDITFYLNDYNIIANDFDPDTKSILNHKNVNDIIGGFQYDAPMHAHVCEDSLSFSFLFDEIDNYEFPTWNNSQAFFLNHYLVSGNNFIIGSGSYFNSLYVINTNNNVWFIDIVDRHNETMPVVTDDFTDIIIDGTTNDGFTYDSYRCGPSFSISPIAIPGILNDTALTSLLTCSGTIKLVDELMDIDFSTFLEDYYSFVPLPDMFTLFDLTYEDEYLSPDDFDGPKEIKFASATGSGPGGREIVPPPTDGIPTGTIDVNPFKLAPTAITIESGILTNEWFVLTAGYSKILDFEWPLVAKTKYFVGNGAGNEFSDPDCWSLTDGVPTLGGIHPPRSIDTMMLTALSPSSFNLDVEDVSVTGFDATAWSGTFYTNGFNFTILSGDMISYSFIIDLTSIGLKKSIITVSGSVYFFITGTIIKDGETWIAQLFAFHSNSVHKLKMIGISSISYNNTTAINELEEFGGANLTINTSPSSNTLHITNLNIHGSLGNIATFGTLAGPVRKIDVTNVILTNYANIKRIDSGRGPKFTLLKDVSVTFGIPTSIWCDSSYIYVGADNDLSAYSFDGVNFTKIDSSGTGYNLSIFGDGTYIYVADYDGATGGLRAYSFNGVNLSLLDTYSNPSTYRGVWCDGTYIYAVGSNGLSAFTFNGVSFTFITNIAAGDSLSVIGDGTYIYVSTAGGIAAYSFNGVTFTFKDSISGAGSYGRMAFDGSYIYVGDITGTAGLQAFSFNGTALSLLDTKLAGWQIYDVLYANGYIYACTNESSNTVQMYTFNGSTFTLISAQVSQGGFKTWYCIGADATRIYLGNYYASPPHHLLAYEKFTYTSPIDAYNSVDGGGNVGWNFI